MKKLMLALLLMMAPLSVHAYELKVDSFYGIEWEKQLKVEREELRLNTSCGDTPLFTRYVDWWNGDKEIMELFNVFDDGLFVIHLTEKSYNGSNYYTCLKENDTIIWIREGVCTQDNQYTMLSTDVDIEEKERDLYTKWKNRTLDAFDEGYMILRTIEGITTIQKVKLIMKGTQILATRSLWPN